MNKPKLKYRAFKPGISTDGILTWTQNHFDNTVGEWTNDDIDMFIATLMDLLRIPHDSATDSSNIRQLNPRHSAGSVGAERRRSEGEVTWLDYRLSISPFVCAWNCRSS